MTNDENLYRGHRCTGKPQTPQGSQHVWRLWITDVDHRCVLIRMFFPEVAAQCTFLEEISPLLARIFSSGSQNLQKFPGIFLALFEFSCSPTPCPACLLILFHSGDIQVLEKCTQLTKVNFYDCRRITGGCCFEERSSSRLRASALFWGEFSCMRILREFSRVARRTCRKFLEFSSLHSNTLAQSYLP